MMNKNNDNTDLKNQSATASIQSADNLPSKSATKRPLFGKVGTSILTIVSVFGFFGVQIAMLLASLLIVIAIMPSKFADIDHPMLLVDSDGTVLGVSIVLNLLAIALFVFMVIKLRKKKITEYLQFNPFTWKITAISFGLWIAYLMASELVFYLLGNQPMGFLDVYYDSAEPLWLLLLGIVVLAPIYEELIFRGLIWRAIAEQFVSERTGAIVASVLAGALFAGIHLQYDIYEVGAIFVFALILGFARYRSGSIWLPIVLHIANNGLSMAQYIWTQ